MTLDELLQTHRVSMREVARRGGPPVSTLRRWRLGMVVPRAATVARLARALGVDVAEASAAALGSVAAARRQVP